MNNVTKLGGRAAFALVLGLSAAACVGGQVTSQGGTATNQGATTTDTSTSASTSMTSSSSGSSLVGGIAPDISLTDVNPTSASFEATLSPHDLKGRVSAWYFGHST